MTLPLKYNLRSLLVRWRSTLTTVGGISLTVAVFVLVMALAGGLRSTYLSTGDARNLLVIRKGALARVEQPDHVRRSAADQVSGGHRARRTG